MNYGSCVHCDGFVYESDERVSLSLGVAHVECHERFQEQAYSDMERESEEQALRLRRESKLLARLKKRLKPKIWSVIEMIQQQHLVNQIAIDAFEDVKGTKISALDWFGESVGIRTVYDETSSCSYSGTYGGAIWIPIGAGRYLHMHISG